MKRREFITVLGGATAGWPIAAHTQQAALPIIAVILGQSADPLNPYADSFRRGLSEAGYTEGRNVTIESYRLDGRYDRLPALMEDIVRRRAAVIATWGSPLPALAAKAATATIPIVFGVGEDPVKLGLVASLARPGSNATGMNFFNGEVVAKRLGLMHLLVPKATRVAVFVNPRDAVVAESTLQSLREAAWAAGLQIQTINASTIADIDAAFAAFSRERPDALFVVPDPFFVGRRVRFATLAARDRIAGAFPDRIYVQAGGLMSYGSDFASMTRQLGVYVGTILKGAKPAELPVQQSTRFEFVINLGISRKRLASKCRRRFSRLPMR